MNPPLLPVASLALYGPADLALIPWPATPEGQRARAWLTPLLLEGSQTYVANVRTGLWVLIWGDLILPVTVNRSESGNSYVCSPFSHYVTYALEELRELRNPPLERALAPVLRGLGQLLRLGRIDHAVHVNNWLLSTNLYPPLERTQVEALTRFLIARFPDCALLWRSISPDVLGTLDWPICPAQFPTPYRQIPSRSVLLLDARARVQHGKRDFRRDLKLLRSSPYTLRDARPEDLERIRELYGLLYLDKYSRQNPQFTSAFFALALEKGLLEFRVLEAGGRVDGVLGFYTRAGAMTCPILGYDTALPQDLGLYRLLSAYLALEAEGRGLILHASSGVAGFKRSRGAVSALEVSAVYTAHLPPARRAVWTLLERVVKRAWKLLEVRGL